MSEWISVDDELPPEDLDECGDSTGYSVDVLITDGENVGTGYHEYEYFGEPGESCQYSSPQWYPHGEVLDSRIGGWPNVTHWMRLPLPPLPKDEK